MNSGVSAQSGHWTSVGPSTGGPAEPWFLRKVPYSEPNGDYTKDCWLSIYGWDDNGYLFNDGSCGSCHTVYVCSTNDWPAPRPESPPPANPPPPYAPPPPVRPPPSSPLAAAGEVCEQALQCEAGLECWCGNSGTVVAVQGRRLFGAAPDTTRCLCVTFYEAARRRALRARRLSFLSKRRKAAYQRKKRKAHKHAAPHHP